MLRTILWIMILACFAGGLAFSPSDAHADDYWNNYWGWYDNTYRPYYHRYYRDNPYQYLSPLAGAIYDGYQDNYGFRNNWGRGYRYYPGYGYEVPRAGYGYGIYGRGLGWR